jgi:hypothetical protein
MQDEIAAVIAEEIRTTVVNAFQPYGQGFVDAATMLAWADRLSAASSSPGETREPALIARLQAAITTEANANDGSYESENIRLRLSVAEARALLAALTLASPHGPSSGEGA